MEKMSEEEFSSYIDDFQSYLHHIGGDEAGALSKSDEKSSLLFQPGEVQPTNEFEESQLKAFGTETTKTDKLDEQTAYDEDSVKASPIVDELEPSVNSSKTVNGAAEANDDEISNEPNTVNGETTAIKEDQEEPVNDEPDNEESVNGEQAIYKDEITNGSDGVHEEDIVNETVVNSEDFDKFPGEAVVCQNMDDQEMTEDMENDYQAPDDISDDLEECEEHKEQQDENESDCNVNKRTSMDHCKDENAEEQENENAEKSQCDLAYNEEEVFQKEDSQAEKYTYNEYQQIRSDENVKEHEVIVKEETQRAGDEKDNIDDDYYERCATLDVSAKKRSQSPEDSYEPDTDNSLPTDREQEQQLKDDNGQEHNETVPPEVTDEQICGASSVCDVRCDDDDDDEDAKDCEDDAISEKEGEYLLQARMDEDDVTQQGEQNGVEISEDASDETGTKRHLHIHASTEDNHLAADVQKDEYYLRDEYEEFVKEEAAVVASSTRCEYVDDIDTKSSDVQNGNENDEQINVTEEQETAADDEHKENDIEEEERKCIEEEEVEGANDEQKENDIEEEERKYIEEEEKRYIEEEEKRYEYEEEIRNDERVSAVACVLISTEPDYEESAPEMVTSNISFRGDLRSVASDVSSTNIDEMAGRFEDENGLHEFDKDLDTIVASNESCSEMKEAAEDESEVDVDESSGHGIYTNQSDPTAAIGHQHNQQKISENAEENQALENSFAEPEVFAERRSVVEESPVTHFSRDGVLECDQMSEHEAEANQNNIDHDQTSNGQRLAPDDKDKRFGKNQQQELSVEEKIAGHSCGDQDERDSVVLDASSSSNTHRLCDQFQRLEESSRLPPLRPTLQQEHVQAAVEVESDKRSSARRTGDAGSQRNGGQQTTVVRTTSDRSVKRSERSRSPDHDSIPFLDDGIGLPCKGITKNLLAQWRQIETEMSSDRSQGGGGRSRGVTRGGVRDGDGNSGGTTGNSIQDEILRMRSQSCDPWARSRDRDPSADGNRTTNGDIYERLSRVTDDDQYRSQPSLTKAMKAKFERMQDHEMMAGGADTHGSSKNTSKKTYKWQVKELTTVLGRPLHKSNA